MEITFIHNEELYRIDGADRDNPSLFWAEMLEPNTLEPTEDYRSFPLDELIVAMSEGITQTGVDACPD